MRWDFDALDNNRKMELMNSNVPSSTLTSISLTEPTAGESSAYAISLE